MLAAYFFRFYCQDQSIRVGERKSLLFFIDPWLCHMPNISESHMVFHNASSEEGAVEADCTVLKIHHVDFGEVSEIRADSFTYEVVTPTGTFYVNSEEEPGACSPSRQVSGWMFTVEIELHERVS